MFCDPRRRSRRVRDSASRGACRAGRCPRFVGTAGGTLRGARPRVERCRVGSGPAVRQTSRRGPDVGVGWRQSDGIARSRPHDERRHLATARRHVGADRLRSSRVRNPASCHGRYTVRSRRACRGSYRRRRPARTSGTLAADGNPFLHDPRSRSCRERLAHHSVPRPLGAFPPERHAMPPYSSFGFITSVSRFARQRRTRSIRVSTVRRPLGDEPGPRHRGPGRRTSPASKISAHRRRSGQQRTPSCAGSCTGTCSPHTPLAPGTRRSAPCSRRTRHDVVHQHASVDEVDRRPVVRERVAAELELAGVAHIVGTPSARSAPVASRTRSRSAHRGQSTIAMIGGSAVPPQSR